MTSHHASAKEHSDERSLHLRDAVDLFLRNLWWILGITAVIAGATAYYVWTTPPIFEGRATIHVSKDRAEDTNLEFLSKIVSAEDVETEMALLRARSVAEATVDSLSLQVQILEPTGLSRSSLFSVVSAGRGTIRGRYVFQREGSVYVITDSDGREVGRVERGEPVVFNDTQLALASPPSEGGEDFPDFVEISIHPFYEAVENLSRALAVGRLYRDASVISVSYQGTDPGMVRDVPNMVASVYIQHRRTAKKSEATSTVNFLRGQIETYTTQLQDAEQQLLAFQQGEQVVNIQAEGAEQVRRLVDAQAQRDDLQSELESLDELLAQIDSVEAHPGSLDDRRNPYRRLAAFPTFLQNQAVTSLMSDLNRLETERADMATRRTPNHPDMVALQRSIDQLEDQLYQLARNYRNSLQSRLATTQERLKAFGSQLEQIPEKALQEARLTRQQKVLEQVYTLLQNRLKEAEIAQAVVPGDVRIVDRAILPLRPVRPRKTRSLALALFFGAIVGTGASMAREQLDERLHSRDELARVAHLPVLAAIPRIRTSANGKSGGSKSLSKGLRERLITWDDVTHPVSEAYRSLRTNITFLDLDRPRRVLVLTSPGPSEGKSTSAANLAITLAQQGANVLLVDADLRRGILHRVFDVSGSPGLTDTIMGSAVAEDAIRRIELDPGRFLNLLPAGTLPPNPAEILGSKRMRDLLESLKAKYDFVLLDTPPLNLVTDAAVLGAESDSVILVARAGSTVRGALRYALDQLGAVKAPMGGVIFNDVSYSGREKYYGSNYGYSDRYYRYDPERRA